MRCELLFEFCFFMMVAAVSTPINPKTTPAASPRQNHNPTRPPLIPSDPDNALAPRRPKSREVTSRYMSSSSSSSTAKRSPSPLISRPAGMMTPMPSAPSTIKRSQSVERRRPATPRSNSLDLKIGSGNGVEVSNAQRMLITSARSLSVSFQGESFSLQVSKAKPAPTPISSRKGTPERRKGTPIPPRGTDQVENSRPVEQQRWPGRLRQPNSMTRSMDCGDSRRRLTGSGVNSNVVRALQSSLVDSRSSIESRLSSNSSNTDSEKHFVVRGSDIQNDHPVNSDTESVSSGSTSESIGNAGGGQAPRSRGVMVQARFWQETNNKLRRQPEPTSPISRTVGSKVIGPPKLIAPKKLGIDSPISSPKGVSNTRGQLSPIRGGALRPASPSKLGTRSATQSPMRGVSPSRMRNAVGAVVNSNLNNLNNPPSILSFAADIRRSKSGEHRMVDVHFLRILYNRLLQWRFTNARADSALSVQRSNAETSLHNARIKTSELLESVRAKRTELQWLRQNLKIISILKGQIEYLEEMALIDKDFACSLSGAIEALQASTLRLPIVGGARADVQKVKDAVCSAVDVMQAMASSICLLLSKVGGVNSLVAELANVAANERAMLGQCNDLLSVISAMQVKECSLRTHFLQLEREFPA
ncbi:QWRF motif-containing protein 2-like [Euphorbia lathyris]|uniref:QWRF motif-containing protein 2-like n=1 Tax=Euphorbia lathyris TaxID=212925 RepID=UPI003313179B